MVRRKKTTSPKLLSLLTALALCLTVFTVPVSAEDGNGDAKQKDEKTKLAFLDEINTNMPEPAKVVPIYDKKNGRWDKVHSNMGTFEKNTILSPEQKEYSIKKYEAVVSALLEPEMSDLEKYYTLAIWLNHHVNYDWSFWPGGYDFDYYTHQWDAYGVLKERKSVCAGIAVAYAHLCHAADLPCKFVRMKPYYLDHTINVIPDINGHSYYIDVTENYFFMSEMANPWDPMDLEFAHIPEAQRPSDGSFEYSHGNEPVASGIKEYYGVPFDKWFTEYALHENTKKKFKTDYVEKGSGTPGIHYAKYGEYPKQYSDKDLPDLWFLEDFYKDPKEIRSKVLGKKFDEQLLNISGIKENYDCTTAEELATLVSNDIGIKYFPSSENGEVVPTAKGLTQVTDYTVACDPKDFDPQTGEATITITGTGDYSGDYRIPVRINTSAVTKAPENKMNLTYTGKPQQLIEPGTVENGTILYAFYNKSDEDESWKNGDPDAAPYPEPNTNITYSEDIPTATTAGKYAVWYQVKGDETHLGVPPQRLARVAVISPIKPKILAKDITMKAGEKVKISPALDVKRPVKFGYLNYNQEIATADENGVVQGISVGTATISIGGTLKDNDPNYADPSDIEISVKVTKGNNPMKLKAKTAKVRRSKLRKKAQTIKRAGLITVSKQQGKLTYKLVSVKKGKKSFKRYFKINSKTGNVTVKKGLKKGKYLVKVKVKAAGNANYKPSSWKSVTSKVYVK